MYVLRYLSMPWPVWTGLLASLALLALLLAFHQVVEGGVQQGQLRRQADAVHADATWRCKALRGTAERRQCLAQLGAASAPRARP